jgi:diaminopimelate epimerase
MATLVFTKMHGAGNDFIMLDAADLVGRPPLSSRRIAELCDRRTGIGADGLIVVGQSAGADLSMDYWNADGGSATMCGNGARCTVAFAHRRGLIAERGTLATAVGPLAFRVHGPGDIEVDLPEPRDLQLNLALPGSHYGAHHACNTGVPHLVIPVNKLETIEVEREGPGLRRHPYFSPDGVNVNWVSRVPGSAAWSIRTFERGVEAETLACGTGAAATAVVLHSLGLATSPVAISVRSGDLLHIGVDVAAPRLSLRGPAVVAFTGEVASDA